MHETLLKTKFLQSVRAAIREQGLVQFWLETDLFLPYKIDEMSILFSTPALLRQFRRWAEDEGGLDVFNANVRDHMEGNGPVVGQSVFDVRFEFMRWPGAEWRIEALCATGRAPLHSARLDVYGEACIMHASFKCEDLATYEKDCNALAEAGLELAGTYRNSYGVFSYWGGGRVWLKPRVNLRDAPTPS